MPPKVFSQHLAYLAKSGFTGLDLSSAVQSEAEKPIALTFDDGFEDFYQTAAPQLGARNMGATVFLVANHIGGTNEWDTKLGDVSAPLMSLEQIKELMERGFEFGSHTLTHCHLDQVDEAAQRDELFGSKSALEAKLDRPVDTFCYPYGGYNQTTLSLVREAGYRFATTCDKGHNTSETDPVKLNRIVVRHDTSLPIFIYKLWRWYKRGR